MGILLWPIVQEKTLTATRVFSIEISKGYMSLTPSTNAFSLRLRLG